LVIAAGNLGGYCAHTIIDSHRSLSHPTFSPRPVYVIFVANDIVTATDCND